VGFGILERSTGRIRVKCDGCGKVLILELEGMSTEMTEAKSSRAIYSEIWGGVNEPALDAVQRDYEEMLEKEEGLKKYEFYGRCPHCEKGIVCLVWTPRMQ
jgi:hypothetical protein